MRTPRRAPILLAVAALAFLVAPAPTSAEVSTIPIEQLILRSDEILIGRVVEIVEVPVETTEEVEYEVEAVPLAKVEVLEWLKGEPKPKHLWVWGLGTWICDITHLIQGERAFFFLDRGEVKALVSPASFERLRAATGGTPLRTVAWAGRGRMPITPIEGRPHADIWGEIRLPPETETAPGRDPRYTSFRRLVPVESLRATVKRLLANKVTPQQDRSILDLLYALSGTEDERCEASEQLYRVGSAARPVLMRVLRDSSSPLREAAALALDGVLDDARDQVLLAALASDDAGTRRAAAFVFESLSRQSSIWDEAVLPALRKATRDRDPEVRWRALWTLVRDEEERALPALLARFRDVSADVKWQAIRALQEVAPFIRQVPPAQRQEAESRLLGFAQHESVRFRRAAWETLAEMATSASAKAALRAVKDIDPVVRVNAACALARFRSAEAVRAQVKLLEHADPWIRRAAAYSLGTSKPPAGIQPLIKTLHDEDESVAALAAWALGEFGPKAAAAVPVLEEVAKAHPDTGLAYDAEAALREIVK